MNGKQKATFLQRKCKGATQLSFRTDLNNPTVKIQEKQDIQQKAYHFGDFLKICPFVG